MIQQPIDLLDEIKKIAIKAGQAVLEVYEHGQFELIAKEDESPVTSADYLANDIILAGLAELDKSIPIISEESPALPLAERKSWPRFWLIDPIDGTQEFVSRSGDFAVNIALVENGWPVLGVIYWPVKDIIYYAVKGHGAYKQQEGASVKINVKAAQSEEQVVNVAVSRVQKKSSTTKHLFDEREYEFVPLGSCSLKCCAIAEGLADCYLRTGPTGEWDTGASHCILEEAGGSIVDSEFNTLSYNCRETFSNPDFVVLGDEKFNWKNIIKSHKTLRKY